jgi:hypothetical protein
LANLRAVQHVGTRESGAVVASIVEIETGVTTSAEEDVQEGKNKDIGSRVLAV